jgi:adenylate cyclase
VLLSSSSVISENVTKEIALAAERKKKILPLDLEPVAIPNEMAYHLAGLQRAPMTNIDSIIRALGKLGLEATSAPPPRITHEEKDPRKSLIIMPFEDLSPTQDNQWFADGLAGELIDMLGKIKSLRILDRKTSLDLRGVKQTTIEIGKLFNTRYFVEGSVRKFGEQIKISISLLDIETGDHLWQESYKGVMADIFDLQESVAAQVVEELKLHLTKEEQSLLEQRGTENAEAYELLMKAREYSNRGTREGYELLLQLSEEAYKLDPRYARAYSLKAQGLINLYRAYDRNPALLDEAERLCNEARRQDPSADVYSPSINILLQRGRYEEAEQLAKEWIAREPQNDQSHFTLGSFYSETRQSSKAIAPYEAFMQLNPENLTGLTNLIIICDDAGEKDKCTEWSYTALPLIERYLRLHPDDEDKRVYRAMLLHSIGNDAQSLVAARELIDEHSPRQIRDGRSLYNTACLFTMLDQKKEALGIFQRSIEAGFRYIQLLQAFLVEENGGVASLSGTPEYEEVKRMVEVIVREAETKQHG